MSDALKPRDEADLVAAIADAAHAGTPLSVHGAGTKDAIGRPVQAARTLSLSGLSGITLYEPAEMVIAARAGTPLSEVEAALAGKGQMLPFEPLDYRALLGAGGEPTVGGVVGANLSGPRRVVAGACRDSLIGVRLVNGRGEVIRAGGRVMKNVTGLDLVKGVCGSWGTLAAFSEVTFKVLPTPETAATLVLHGLADAAAVEAMSSALGSPFEVSAAAHLPGTVERVPKTLLRLEGFAASVTYRAGRLAERLARFGTANRLEGEISAGLWRSVRDAMFLSEPADAVVWRVSVAASKAAAAVASLSETVPLRHFYDWGGGLVWLALPADDDAGAGLVRRAFAGTGAHATLVRAPVELRASVDVFEPLPEPVRRLSAGLKASLDPRGLFNPGRMYAGI
ncbi:glycolate oxidase subunit GlcE [Alsobacter sp. R-9]